MTGSLELERNFLHAAQLEFVHPRTGAQVEGEAPLASGAGGLPGAGPGLERLQVPFKVTDKVGNTQSYWLFIRSRGSVVVRFGLRTKVMRGDKGCR